MRLGLVADIHDDAVRLRAALARFRERSVDRVLTLGDSFETLGRGDPGAEVARLLAEAGAIGVWGNHDFGLCHDVGEEVRRLCVSEALAFTTGLRPTLVLDDCRFTHIEPHRDPFDIIQLWAFDGVPRTIQSAEASFAAVPERVLFVGHFHRWFAVRSNLEMDWAGERDLELPSPGRFLVGLGATCNGACAIYDTGSRLLQPIALG